MYPRFAIITEETQPSAAPETLPIEIEIGALIKKAGESLRDQSRSSTSDVDKTHSRSPSAPQEGVFDITVKDTGQEAPIWDLTIGDADRIPDPSRSTRTTHLEFGQPINSDQCSETADGVPRESEGRSRLSLLVRQSRCREQERDAQRSSRRPAALRTVERSLWSPLDLWRGPMSMCCEKDPPRSLAGDRLPRRSPRPAGFAE